MKKRFVLFIFALFITFSTYGQNSLYEGSGGKNHTIMFANSILENGVFDQSDEWICKKIKTNLISAISRFGGFLCIDMDSSKNLLKVQKELESGIYDDRQSIEIGKLMKAKEIINIVSTRLSSGAYSLTITLFNVETGVILGMFSSPKTYETAESFALQAHYECVPFILNQLGIKQTAEGKRILQSEMETAKKQVAENKHLAAENAKIEAERTELAQKQAKIIAEEKSRKEAAEKAELEANRKALEQKKAEEAAKKIKEKERNPFANETYETEFENGSKYDKYILKFISQNQCTVTVISENSQGLKNEVSATGSYSYSNGILSISIRLKNNKIKHVQNINWKGVVTFKNPYSTFHYMIPVNSNNDAKKIRAEFQKK
ncbi:MAG: cell envelope integrity protein TolA [Treponema sp.]|nr:cell envelope integrity protein TolA [Treponema sp.]MDD6929798.1 cell envelope integrity protein TolA [Treponema sp.]MDD7612175.1 cell envelope integrity protein TolA [Spirochaetales bacterium]MDY5763413.1 cell envelope integrity protein TolA [Treponema sp.]MDY5916002.1 cell envelope integrity protein TolA [Treponema sp.]